MSDVDPKEPRSESPDEADEDGGYGLAPAAEETAPVAIPIEVEEPAEAVFVEDPPTVEPETQLLPGGGLKPPARPEEEPEPEPGPPPSLRPFTPLRLLLWPMQGRYAPDFLGKSVVLPFVLLGGWLLHHLLPFVGIALHVALALGVALAIAFYPWRVILAVLEGRAGPPEWVRLSADNESIQESARVTGLLILHLSPMIVAAFAGAPTLLLCILGLLGWTLFPAALLLLSAGAALRFADPARAWRLARAGERGYVICLVPGALVLAGRILTGASFWGVFLEALILPTAVYTAVMLGCLARENEQVTAQLLRIAELTKELRDADADAEEE